MKSFYTSILEDLSHKETMLAMERFATGVMPHFNQEEVALVR